MLLIDSLSQICYTDPVEKTPKGGRQEYTSFLKVTERELQNCRSNMLLMHPP